MEQKPVSLEKHKLRKKNIKCTFSYNNNVNLNSLLLKSMFCHFLTQFHVHHRLIIDIGQLQQQWRTLHLHGAFSDKYRQYWQHWVLQANSISLLRWSIAHCHVTPPCGCYFKHMTTKPFRQDAFKFSQDFLKSKLFGKSKRHPWE